MLRGDQWGLAKRNQELSNIYSGNGALDGLGWYLCPDGRPRNFLLSGGGQPGERYEPLVQFFGEVVGRLPVIIVHNHDHYIEALASTAWRQAYDTQSGIGPLVIANTNDPQYEPFYGMNEPQIVTCLRMIAEKLGYSTTARFESTVRAHLDILRALSIPYSLSGLYFLCQFKDMGEFYRNVMALPCGEGRAKSIWAQLGAGSDDTSGQFELFRAVIDNLSSQAEQSAWNTNQSVSAMNCLSAIKGDATLVLSVNDMYADLFLAYLAEELKGNAYKPFILLLDGVRIKDQLYEYLQKSGSICCCGIVAENAVEIFGGDERAFFRMAEKIECFILFKHSTAQTAKTLSEILGRCDQLKTETSRGVNRGFFSLFPQGSHNDIRYSTENTYRVKPEEITGLRAGQAFVFDTAVDQIIRFNC